MHQLSQNPILRYVLYLLAFLPLFLWRDFTPDNELRYLSIADEALKNGSLFTFLNHGEIYADKPPLYLWIVMLGKWLLGYHSMLFLGLFSLIPALVIVYILDQWTRNVLGEDERIVARLMLLTSAFFVGSAVVLRMDMLMCMFIVLALYTFFRMYEGNGRPADPILFPLYIFLALFTKGPVGLIVPFVSVVVFLVLKKDYKAIGKYWGWKTLIILLFLCSIWFAGVYAEAGPGYLNNLLFNQTINRAVNAFHHKEPAYYYLLAFWYVLAPWSLLLGTVLWKGMKKPLLLGNLELFFLVISFSTVITLSLFSSKLAVYLLPALPFFVYLPVIWFPKFIHRKWALVLAGIPSALLCMAFPAILIFAFIAKTSDLQVSAPILLASVLLSATGVFSIGALLKRRLVSGIKFLGNGLLVSVFSLSFAVPGLNHLIGLEKLCDRAKAIAAEKGQVNYYYCEMSRGDNLDVYLSDSLKELRKADLVDKSKIKEPALIFIWGKAVAENDTVKAFVEGKKIFHTGNYYLVEVENNK